MAARRLGDRKQAADVVQDAFLRYAVASGSGSLSGPVRSPRHFLWRVVENLILDLQRSARRCGTHAPLDTMAEHLADPLPQPDRVLELRQDLATLHRACESASAPSARIWVNENSVLQPMTPCQ